MHPRSTEAVSLTPELQQLVEDTIASGRYRSADEVIAAALQAMRDGSDPVDPTPAELASSREMAALFAQAAAGMAQCDLEGRFLRVNDYYCAIVGRSRDDLLRLRMQDITAPDDLPGNLSQFREMLETGEPFITEKRYVRPDGSAVWVRNAVSPVRSGSGPVETAVSICIEITARKSSEDALRESEALKSAILNAALDCIVTIDDESCVIEWNHAAEATFGYSRQAVLGRDLAALIIPHELRDNHYRGMRRYLATGQGPVIGRRVELEALRADGTRFPVELAISPILIRGKPHFTAYLRDITERKRGEEALRQSEQRLRATYEHAFVGIGEVDRDGRFLRANEQFCVICGYSAEELQQRTFADITHPADRDADIEQFRRQIAGEIQAYTLEKRYIHKDGHVVWMELSASTVNDATGRPVYGVRVVRDISHRKRSEDHQQLLINELNHRVKNTLATVQSITTQTLRNASTPEEARAAIESRLIALSGAHDVLTRENWEAASVHEIVAHAVRPFDEGGGRISFAGPPVRLSPHLALAIAMALHELATNAAKYGSLSGASGAVAIRWTLRDAADGQHLELTWEESGGPPVAAPARRGFGTRLIERSLQNLHGKTAIAFKPTGVVCVIEALLTPAA